MARLAVLLSVASIHPFWAFNPSSNGRISIRRRLKSPTLTRQNALYASMSSSGYSDDPVSSVEFALSNATNTAFETLSEAVSSEDDVDEGNIAKRNEMVQMRAGAYKVSFSVSDLEEAGVTFKDISPSWKLSDVELDLESLDLKIPDTTAPLDRLSIESLQKIVDNKYSGVIVDSIRPGGKAWEAGIKVGDTLLTTSGAVGEVLWPKSSLYSLRSSIKARKASAKDVVFEFKRVAENVNNQYELTLKRPLGFQIKETEDGFVEVSGFSDNVSNLVKYAVRVGDRVVAVESALGNRMWPVSTVDGVISACTGRLPGQTVRIQFERPQAVAEQSPPMNSMEDQVPLMQEATIEQGTEVADATVTSAAPTDPEKLLKRCRDTIRRFTLEENSDVKNKFMDKFSLPAMVADKVMDAISEASISVDCRTLSMIMRAYLSCGNAEGAIRSFELSTGLSGDGSLNAPSTDTGSTIVPSTLALNLYTASSLLKAHALKGNLDTIERIIGAMEGRSGEIVNGLEVATWPETGEMGSLFPDTQFYNMAMMSMVDAGSVYELGMALEIFDKLSEPSKIYDDRRPQKDIVSYNTIISAYARYDMHNEALSLFTKMTRAGVKPDKFTYTALIPACVNDGDVEELLYDMKDQGVKADIVTYNTVIKSFCDDGMLYEAKEVITEMESRGISPDAKTYGLLMNGLIKTNKPDACLSLFEAACTDIKTSAVTESVHLYTTAITAASMRKDHAKALELVSRMNALGIRPNFKTLTALVGACMSSGKHDLATKVYEQIPNPDGYAMFQGLRAYCSAGDIEAASSILSKQRNGRRFMSGKQKMMSYDMLMEALLKNGDYDGARALMKDFLKKGFIPSKKTMMGIIDSLGFVSRNGLIFAPTEAVAEETFRFLLFVLDSMRGRNLPLSASLYSAVIVCGNVLGGMYKRVASLMIEARKTTSTDFILKDGARKDNKDDAVEQLDIGWEDLVKQYDNYEKRLTEPDFLPLLDVRIGEKETRKVFMAEKVLVNR